MPEAAVAPAPAAAVQTTDTTPPANTSADTYPGLSADLDDMIGKSGLGTSENEQRVSKGSRIAKPKAIAPAKTATEEKKPEEIKPAEQKPAETKPVEKTAEPKPEEKPADKPAEQAAAAKTDKPKEEGPWTRTHKAERRVKELEAQVQELSTRKPGDDPEKLEFKTKWETAEKARKALDDEMRYLRYENSTEFKEQHYTPYVSKWERAIAQVRDLKIANPDGTSRTATAEDLSKIVQIGSNDEAATAAEELFGNPTKAAFVLGLRNQLREAHYAMEAAKADFKAKGEERQKEYERQQKEQQEAEQKTNQRFTTMWDELNKAAIDQHKDWFVAAEGDAEGAELLKKGFELADLAWTGSDKIDAEKLIALRSAERNKAAGFRYQVHLNQKANARIAELEKKLKEYEDSEPGEGEARREEKKDGYDVDAAIARIPRV